LKRRYAPLEQETMITAVSNLFHFRRHPSEGVDQLLSRFELINSEAEQLGQLVLPVVLKSWMLLNVLKIPVKSWELLLHGTQGILPVTDQDYARFLQYVRRNGHLYESSTSSITQHFFADDGSNEQFLPIQNDANDWHESNSVEYQNHHTYWTDGADGYQQQGWEEDDDDQSSGHSNNEEPVDLTEVNGMDPNTAGEQLYLQYRSSKRKFRKFTNSSAGRSTMKRRKGSGKGKAKSKGKGKGTFYGTSPQWDDWGQSQETYAFQKGGKPSGKRTGNPIGSDGKVMKCSKCGSDQHFIRFCPQNTDGPKPSGKGNGYVTIEHWSRQPGANPSVGQSGFFEAMQPEFVPSIRFEDGTFEPLSTTLQNSANFSAFMQNNAEAISSASAVEVQRTSFQSMTDTQKRLWQFPWYEECYHTQVRLATGQEGLLVDTGAMGNLCGDVWAGRVEALAKAAGQGSTYKDIPLVQVEGVGNGTSKITQSASIPTCLADGTLGVYSAMVQKNSELPGLYGLISQTSRQAVVDTGNDRIIYPGPGGIQYNLSPGSKVVKCHRAISGHLIMPCSEWHKAKPGAADSAGSRL